MPQTWVGELGEHVQVLTAEILSLYEKRGTDQASAAFTDLQKQADTTTASFYKMSTSASSTYTRIERPISRVGLQVLTRDLAFSTGAFDAMGRGAGQLVEGLGVLASTFTRLAGPIGLVLSIGALVAVVFNRISDASKKAAENLKKQADSMAQLYKDTEDAIQAGLKYGTLTSEQASRLREENRERASKLDRMRDERQRLETLVGARMQELEASRLTEEAARRQVASLEAQGASEAKLGEAKAAVLFASERERSINEQLEAAKRRVAALDKELLALSTARAAVADANNAKDGLALEIARQQNLIILQRAAEYMTLGTVEDALMVKREDLAAAEQAFLDLSVTADRQAVEAAQTRMDVIQAEIAVLERRQDTMKALQQKEKAINTQRAAQFRQVSNVLAAGFENADKRIIYSWRSTMAATVEAAATAISTHLLMKAAENFKNPVLAAAYIAAAGVVQGLGSAAAGAIRAGAPGAGGEGSVPGGGETGTGAAAETGATQRPQTVLNVNVQGDYIGETAFIDKLAQRLSERVSGGDVQLNASSARYIAPAVGPA